MKVLRGKKEGTKKLRELCSQGAPDIYVHGGDRKGVMTQANDSERLPTLSYGRRLPNPPALPSISRSCEASQIPYLPQLLSSANWVQSVTPYLCHRWTFRW